MPGISAVLVLDSLVSVSLVLASSFGSLVLDVLETEAAFDAEIPASDRVILR